MHDKVVPFWHGDELLRSFPPECRAEPFWVDGLGHNSIELHAKTEYTQRVISFLDQYVLANENTFNNANQPFCRKYEPMAVPKYERYQPENSLTQSGKVFVNRTWMQHGTDIINEAVRSKNATKKVSRKAMTSKITNKPTIEFQHFKKPSITRERSTSEILAELNMQGNCQNPAEDNDDMSDASRFITTRDSQLDDEDSGDDLCC